MTKAIRAPLQMLNRSPRTTYTTNFKKRQQKRSGASQDTSVGRIPRVTRLLALAHKIDGAIRSGEIRDWARAARLVGVTRARMTQIANLLLLAPEIQEKILTLSSILEGRDSITERDTREAASHMDWRTQAVAWRSLRENSGDPSSA